MKVQNVFLLLAAQAIRGVLSAPVAAPGRNQLQSSSVKDYNCIRTNFIVVASTLEKNDIEKKGVAEVWANW
jgi:hypothetical protein